MKLFLGLVLTALLTAGVVGYGILLWQDGKASVGDLVLLTALAFTIRPFTRMSKRMGC